VASVEHLNTITDKGPTRTKQLQTKAWSVGSVTANTIAAVPIHPSPGHRRRRPGRPNERFWLHEKSLAVDRDPNNSSKVYINY